MTSKSRWIEFEQGPLDGVTIEVQEPMDAALFVTDSGSLIRYECDRESEYDDATYYNLVPSRDPESFDEEIVASVRRNREQANDQ